MESIVIAHNPEIIVITETWLNSDIGDYEITPSGYCILRNDRDTRGGGVAIIFKDSLELLRLPDIIGIECVVVKVILKECALIIGGFYRPPSSDISFYERLNNFLLPYRNHSSNLMLVGDFNVPHVAWDNDFPYALSNEAEHILDLVLFHDLTQLVHAPTRVQGTKQSVLDLFLVNHRVLQRNPTIRILEGISDHKIVCLDMQLSCIHKVTKRETFVPVFARASDVDVLDVLDSSFAHFVSLYESDKHSVNHLWNFFKNLVTKCIDEFVPRKRKIIRNTNPWITKEIVRLGRRLKKVKQKLKRRNEASTSNLVCALRLQLKNCIADAKAHYQNVQLKKFISSSPAKFWRYLSPNKKSAPTLVLDGNAVTNSSETARILNEYFCSVFTDDNGTEPEFLLFGDLPPIDNIEIDEEGVFSLLLKLDDKKSSGIDNIPNAFLVRYAEWCSKYLNLIFRKSLSRAELPHDWRYAKITPIPKKANQYIPSAYRPISLLCACVKVLEHIIFKHLSAFIESNNIIDSRQHGFRRGLSTVTQLLEMVHDLASGLDKQSQIDILFLDFEKAFDRVSHRKLLIKFKAILKNDSLLAWIEAYLSCRYQCVTVGGTNSPSAPVQSGIPQGSVLGPLFFLVFINDIVRDIPVKIRLFADDCVLYQEVNDPSDQLLLNDSLSKIQDWCTKWQMNINPKKTVAMTITLKKDPLKFRYNLGNHSLSFVSQYTYLGLVITSDLRWNDHIAYIEKKALRKLGYLRRTLAKATRETKLLAYKTYVIPLLEYASPVWDPHTQANIDKLESIQRKSVRFVFNAYRHDTSPSALLESAKLKTLQWRRYHERMKLFYLIYNDKLAIRKTNYIKPILRRETRSSHPKRIDELLCHTNIYRYSFFPRAINEWNKLPPEALESVDLKSFLRALPAPSF